jgi:hypothetical protein
MDYLQYLRLTSIAGAFLVGFWIPVRLIGFHPPMGLEIFFDLVVSLVSVINIYLYFNSTEKSPRDWKSWLSVSLFFDVVCFLPLSLVAFLLFDQTAEWLLLLNLLSARHIRHIKPFLDGFDSLKPITYRLIPILVMYPLLVHIIACGWISLGSGTAGNDPDQLLTYVKSIYWTFTTLTTVGYGDISARTIPQMLYACGVQVVGVGVFGFILSNVAGLLARSDAAREHHMDNLDKIETFMKLHRTPMELRGKIRSYYHYMWINKKGYRDESLIEELPAKIQSELFLHINQPIIQKVSFLKRASPELIEELMCELKPRIFVPGERIFKIGDIGDSLYFIQSGQVDIISIDGNKLATLGEGSFFGEMALLSDSPRSATAVASEYCDIFALHRKSFEQVTKSYPEFRNHIEEVMIKRSA